MQTYRERERDRSVPNIHELSTRTVTMSRDQQDGHGFGICVKGGKDSGMFRSHIIINQIRNLISQLTKVFTNDE